MRNTTVLLGYTLVAGAYASVVAGSHQCVLDAGSSSSDATCSSRSPTLVPFDRYEGHQYTEVALHFLDGTKSVISATGSNPYCLPDTPGHPISSPRARPSRPYKATWTRIRYVASSLDESPCSQDIISEQVNAISVQTLPTDPSGDIDAGTTSYEGSEIIDSEHPAKQLGTTIMSEDVGYTPTRRRATLGELFQLLMLFMVLGALHYVSARFAVRWQGPPPEARRTPQCEY